MTPLCPPLGAGELVAWRLDESRFALTWDSPTKFSYALQLLRAHGADIEEYEVGESIIERVDGSALIKSDIEKIQNSVEVVLRVPGSIAGSRTLPGSAGMRAHNNAAGVLGAFAGGGVGVFLTDAAIVSELSGTGNTYTFNVGFGPGFSIQLMTSGGTWIASVTGKLPAAGLSWSAYPTDTGHKQNGEHQSRRHEEGNTNNYPISLPSNVRIRN